MEVESRSPLKSPAILLIAWVVILYVSIVFSVFLHEDGHGLGARMDGIHVSTGFNRVGDFGKSPADPDFRASGAANNAVWIGLLGPITSWLLAILFTVWLYRFKEPSWGALIVGALAVAASLIRILPMTFALVASLIGKPYIEDEVNWGVWYIVKYVHPELPDAADGFQTLIEKHTAMFLASPAFWIPIVLSLSISLVCLVLAYRQNYRLWSDRLTSRLSRILFGLFPVLVFILSFPVLNWLDQMVRINW